MYIDQLINDKNNSVSISVTDKVCIMGSVGIAQVACHKYDVSIAHLRTLPVIDLVVIVK